MRSIKRSRKINKRRWEKSEPLNLKKKSAVGTRSEVAELHQRLWLSMLVSRNQEAHLYLLSLIRVLTHQFSTHWHNLKWWERAWRVARSSVCQVCSMVAHRRPLGARHQPCSSTMWMSIVNSSTRTDLTSCVMVLGNRWVSTPSMTEPILTRDLCSTTKDQTSLSSGLEQRSQVKSLTSRCKILLLERQELRTCVAISLTTQQCLSILSLALRTATYRTTC